MGDMEGNENLDDIEEIQHKDSDHKLQRNMNKEASITEVKVINMMKRSKAKIKDTHICKVCLGEDSTKENPLIYPCKCSGTMKFIHLDCLKQW